MLVFEFNDDTLYTINELYIVLLCISLYNLKVLFVYMYIVIQVLDRCCI